MNQPIRQAAFTLSASLALLVSAAHVGHAGEPSSSVTADGGAVATQDLGAYVGIVIPRTQLQPGVLLGLNFNRAIGPEGLRARAGLDWVMLSNQDSALVGPPAFPRARLDLIQTSHIVSGYIGASYDVAHVGSIALYGGAQVGVSVNRSTFDAFGMSVPENDVAALGGLAIGARGPAGPVAWNFELGWREARHDLGDSGEFGEDALSGLSISAGVGMGL